MWGYQAVSHGNSRNLPNRFSRRGEQNPYFSRKSISRGPSGGKDVEGSLSYAIDALLCTWITQFRDGATSSEQPLSYVRKQSIRRRFTSWILSRARALDILRRLHTCPPWNFLNAVILPLTLFRRFVKERSWMENSLSQMRGAFKFLKGVAFVTDVSLGRDCNTNRKNN